MTVKRRSQKPSHASQFTIPEKANRVLNVILIFLLLFAVRIWHLSVIQYESRLEESRKPQKRVVMEAASRATIRDRFNIPLAVNNIQYNAAVLYSDLSQIPAITWTNENGKRVKKFRRKEYIKQLSQVLGNELQLDPERLEDLVHAKASFYYHAPFVIKEDISEREYYRLKMLEKDWLGIHVQRLPKRTYPQGKVAAEIIGYMGAINRQEYEAIIHEINGLEQYLAAHEAGEEPSLPHGFKSPGKVRTRVKELKERAYTVNDYVGKAGIEGRFEELLRGFQGKKSYYSDARGNFLRELPGSRDSQPGKRILLTISAELQEYAERLLIQNEGIRQAHISHGEFGLQALSERQPWIKGGSIIAIEPQSGEILAMASYPRFDPNDFVTSGNPDISLEKKSNILRWFETEEYLAQIWDQKRPLERERYDSKLEEYVEQAMNMSWSNYLDIILPSNHLVRKEIDRLANVKNATELQGAISKLLSLSGQSDLYWLLDILYQGQGHQSHGKKMGSDVKQAIVENLSWHAQEVDDAKEIADRYFTELPNDYDKVLLVDLSRLVVNGEYLSQKLLKYIGNKTLSQYRDVSAAMSMVLPVVKKMSKTLFHDISYKEWRQKNEKQFLKEKRAEEKQFLRYPKPYIDHLDAWENQLFTDFWNKQRWQLLEAFLTGKVFLGDLEPYTAHFAAWYEEIKSGAHQYLDWNKSYNILKDSLHDIPPALTGQYFQTLRTFQDLTHPLYGQYRQLRKEGGIHLEKHLASAFYPLYGFGYGRSFAYRQATTQGSIFKLVTAYAALIQRYEQLDTPNSNNINPLSMIDHIHHNGKEWIVGYHLNGQPIPQMYKGGRLPKSSSRNVSRLDIVHAIEISNNPYFALLAGDYLKDPQTLVDAACMFSYGSRTGIDLPGEIPGKIPKDVQTNRTGLYSMAIGQHSLVVTPLQACVMLSTIANGGHVIKPQIVHMTVGTEQKNGDNLFENSETYPYKDSLNLAGIDFPIFTALACKERKNCIQRINPEIKREAFMPDVVRNTLLEGMKRVVAKMNLLGMTGLSQTYHDYPEAISDLLEVQDQMVAKTSTAEAMENLDLDSAHGTNMYTHIWFGTIAFGNAVKTGKTFVFEDDQGRPELVVVVYLRFGKYGRDAAPIAAQIIKKWREIKNASLK